MKVQSVLVAGAGQMGAGIVQVAVQAGLRATMIDVADEFIAKGMAGIEKQLGRAVEKGRITAADRDGALGRITTGLDVSAGADADLFIEAAPEVARHQARPARARRRRPAARRDHRQQHLEPVGDHARRLRRAS